MSGKTRRQILLLFELNSLKQFGAASSKLLFYEKDLTFGETLEKPKKKEKAKFVFGRTKAEYNIFGCCVKLIFS